MTAEENQKGLREDERKDRFPIGMRVLAVDDDPTCLRLIEALLKRCQYNVTTTGQARTALKMLRENRDKFDLVISDVHMPDMDGFKLLELVGLEMDLPVIMLSAISDPSAVMKGITHGACDYLLKPVRIEELKNIWQHVVRKRKVEPKDPNVTKQGGEDAEKLRHGGPITNGLADRNSKLSRKRKDQNEEDDDDYDENAHESDDPSTQKKPRVVWSIELHQQFVAAVNQLGLEKAVPKRILDLMNVQGLTRENVASHLQKYRLYLKRISTQQGNMAAALGGMGVLGRPNNSSGSLGLSGLPSSGVIQVGHAHNSTNSLNNFSKFHQMNFSKNLQSLPPSSLELEQFQHKQFLSRLGDLATPFEDSLTFPVSQQETNFGGCSNNGSGPNSFNNPFLNDPNNSLMPQVIQNRHKLETQPDPSVGLGAINQDSFEVNGAWHSSAPSMVFSPNPLPVSLPLNTDDISLNNVKTNNMLLRENGFGGQSINYGLKQEWEVPHKQAYAHDPTLLLGSQLSPSLPNENLIMPIGQNQEQGQINGMSDLKMNLVSKEQFGHSFPSVVPHSGSEQSMAGSQMKFQNVFSSDGFPLVDDIMNVMVKQMSIQCCFGMLMLIKSILSRRLVITLL
ncbi:hypothetical protein AMTR_s00086p00182350 [Amborella trichopoda]|uniref:Two-component response regulator n=1 Tax=Amborella trichopoda TaxID=13333 RepID=W1P5D2_AMBTC|nr:hypothetical protein AMTR_s00086p00182350 [Amborella trichopoda]